ncbi:MAG: hypothetical protein FP814_07810 [Desulfobacterium sp.]|nr:hypothetical protein [Desulfobacterium sp.]
MDAPPISLNTIFDYISRRLGSMANNLTKDELEHRIQELERQVDSLKQIETDLIREPVSLIK